MNQNIKDYLSKNFNYKLTQTGNLRYSSGKQIKPDELIKKLSTPEYIKKLSLQKEYFEEGFDLELEVNQSLDAIQKEMLSTRQKEKLPENVSESYLPESVIIGVNAFKKETHILNIKYEKMPMVVDAWKEVFGLKLYAELPKIFCDMRYNPYSMEKVRDGEPFKYINTCIHPDWRYENPNKKVELSPLFLEFYKGLFANKESMQYTCSWNLNAIFNRNETALVMVGGKGLGKNIICSAYNRMVGDSNVSNQANNAYTEKFNGFLKNKRIVIADEISFKDGDQKNRVKKYFNKIQSIEEKGRDSETIEVFCSLVMLSNDVRDLYIEADDRRFSCVDLSLTTLPERFTPEQINELRNYIEYDKDFPLAFYQFCKANEYVNFVNALPYKGDTFDKLVLSSLSEVKTAILDTIVGGVTEGFALKDIDFDWDKKYPRRKPSFYYFEEFITNFRYEGKKLGTITKSNRTLDYYISVNPELRASGFTSKL